MSAEQQWWWRGEPRYPTAQALTFGTIHENGLLRTLVFRDQQGINICTILPSGQAEFVAEGNHENKHFIRSTIENRRRRTAAVATTETKDEMRVWNDHTVSLMAPIPHFEDICTDVITHEGEIAYSYLRLGGGIQTLPDGQEEEPYIGWVETPMTRGLAINLSRIPGEQQFFTFGEQYETDKGKRRELFFRDIARGSVIQQEIKEGQVYTVGTAKENNIVLKSDVTSSNHFAFIVSEGKLFLFDGGSENGTTITTPHYF